MDEEIKNEPGIVTKREHSTLSKKLTQKLWDSRVTTYTDLAEMTRDVITHSRSTGTGFYYEDPDDCDVNCYVEIVDSGASEAAIYRGNMQFESFTIGWMYPDKLLIDFLDILGSTEEECSKWKYSGGMKKLIHSKIGGNYAQYAKDLI